MPHYKSAMKRLRQQEKKRLYNKSNKSRMKSTIKKVMESENQETGKTNLNQAFSLIDKLTKKGIIHKNSAAHKKARLAHHVNKLAE